LILELKEGASVEGKLLAFEKDILGIETTEKTKGKKAVVTTSEIPLINIAKAKVTVSFK
jgi:ribosome maturation factor RimP